MDTMLGLLALATFITFAVIKYQSTSGFVEDRIKAATPWAICAALVFFGMVSK